MTTEQELGLRIIFNFIKKKYPFVVNISRGFMSYYTVLVIIDVDFKSYIEYFNITDYEYISSDSSLYGPMLSFNDMTKGRMVHQRMIELINFYHNCLPDENSFEITPQYSNNNKLRCELDIEYFNFLPLPKIPGM